MIEGLLDFLHKVYTNIKIKLIVVDFVVDLQGKVWLTDVKHVKTVKFLRIEEKEQLQHIKRLREKVTKCFMCKKYKPNDEVQYLYTKKVTY